MHKHQNSSAKSTIKSLGRAFQIGIIINIAYVLAEALAGIFTNSMGLLSDAAHNLSDVVTMALALTAYKLSGLQTSRRFTYGYKKSTILIAFLNAIIICVALVFIVVESIEKIAHPQPLQGNVVSIVAAIGVLINGFTAYLFVKDSKSDLNVKSVFFHMLADTLISVGVVISGILMYLTGWYVLDGLIGLAVAVIIVLATWDLFRATVRMVLDGVPDNVDYEEVILGCLRVDGVVDMHHLHIWALSTTENALTSHVIIEDLSELERVKVQLKDYLKTQGIYHVTLEFETPDAYCRNTSCDAGTSDYNE